MALACSANLAFNGVDVLLIERGDFCSGGSAASSHMAHGGIRYLENGEFRLVREAVRERNLMIRNAPHIVKPPAHHHPHFQVFRPVQCAAQIPGHARQAVRARLAHHQGRVDDVRRLHQEAAHRSTPHVSFELKRSLNAGPRLNHLECVNTATYYDGAILQPERLQSR
jgi:glycerol-3-phosphate dehydrogenase